MPIKAGTHQSAHLTSAAMVPCAFQRPRERGANLRAASSPFEVWIWFPDYAIMGSTGPALPEYKLALVLFFPCTARQNLGSWGLSARHVRSTWQEQLRCYEYQFRVYHENMLLKHKGKCAVLRWNIIDHNNRNIGNRVYGAVWF